VFIFEGGGYSNVRGVGRVVLQNSQVQNYREELLIRVNMVAANLVLSYAHIVLLFH